MRIEMQLFLFGILSFLGFSQAYAENVVNIGGLVTDLRPSTSCDIKYWKTAYNSCTCCLVKHTMSGSRSVRNGDAISYCTKKKHCSSQTISFLNNDNLPADRFLSRLTEGVIQNPEISIDQSRLRKSGKLTPIGVRSSLVSLDKNGTITQAIHRFLLGQERCLSVKEVGGAQTAQLFIVGVDKGCLSGRDSGFYSTTYILKETKKQAEEVANLRKIAESQLKSLDLLNPKRDPDNIALAFDVQNFIYKNGDQSHFLSLLVAAPGQSIMSLVKKLAEEIKKHQYNQ